jgi:hypothetical protein
MTVHGAKGLEFPVVVLAGLERQESDGHQPQSVLWTENGSLEAKAGLLFLTDGYEKAAARDQELDNFERQRLLYVGMTRARDHLVLCLHHRARKGRGDSSLASRLFELCEVCPDLWRRLSPDSDGSQTAERIRADCNGAVGPGGDSPAGSAGDGPVKPGGDAQEWRAFYEQWSAKRAALLGTLRRRPVTSATALAETAARTGAVSHGTRIDPGWPDAGAALWQSAEVSLQIGRAVHGALATVDLTTGHDSSGRRADELCRARAFAHGVGEHVDLVASMVGAALRSAVVRRAASRRHWRELYVAVPLDICKDPSSPPTQGVLEGFVDLLFEDDDGLVVVDYKTDRIAGPDALCATAALYWPQVAAYSAALEMSCGRPVSRCVLLFVGNGTPTEHVLEGEELATARAQALEMAAAG